MQRKKIRRMDVFDCMNHSNTAEGSKPLTDPMSLNPVTRRDSLVPQNRHNARRALLSAPSASSACDFVSSVKEVDDDKSILGIDLLCPDDQPSCSLLGNDRQTISDGMCSAGFVSARQYMNPANHILDELLDTADKSTNSTNNSQNFGTRSDIPLRQTSRNASRLPKQKNSLDNYFKPAASFSETQSSTGVRTPVSSPSKTVMRSPIKKLPGSNGIYTCVSASQLDASLGCGSADSQSRASEVGKLSDDDFDFGYRMKPAKLMRTSSSFPLPAKNSKGKNSAKIVNSKNSGKKSKAAVKNTATSVTAKNSVSFFRKQNTLQNVEDFNSSATSELYGMFGFSDKTLIALDSDTDFDEDSNKTNYMSLLPVEVLTNILCRLPFIDFGSNLNLVCLTWRNIICSSEVSAFHFN
jgi:hypothetical protein